MKMPERVRINEVVLRDGLQLENQVVSVINKKRLFDRLTAGGVKSFEFGSFVHPKLVPQMANTGELYQEIKREKGKRELIGLIPNLKGAQTAWENGVNQVNFVLSASNTHNEQNIRKTTDESVADMVRIREFCKEKGIQMEVTLATAFGCPFEGEVPYSRVEAIVDKLAEADLHRITLADTTGMANPMQVFNLVSKVKEKFLEQSFSLHFHNTRGMGLPNILVGLQAGIRSFDTALGGLGGCPFAPGATGNVCTEDVVHMLHTMGIETGIDLDKVIEVSELLQGVVGHETPSYILKAGKSDRKYEVPTH